MADKGAKMSKDVNKLSSGRLFIISFNVQAFFLIFFKIVEKRKKTTSATSSVGVSLFISLQDLKAMLCKWLQSLTDLGWSDSATSPPFLRDPATIFNFLDPVVAFCACHFAPNMEELMSLACRFTKVGHVMFRRDFASCIVINYACIYT